MNENIIHLVDVNEAIMELGQKIFRIHLIYCAICTINENCLSFIINAVLCFPEKKTLRLTNQRQLIQNDPFSPPVVVSFLFRKTRFELNLLPSLLSSRAERPRCACLSANLTAQFMHRFPGGAHKMTVR